MDKLNDLAQLISDGADLDDFETDELERIHENHALLNRLTPEGFSRIDSWAEARWEAWNDAQNAAVWG